MALGYGFNRADLLIAGMLQKVALHFLSLQKPQVEGGIGLILRWFIPKGTNLSEMPDATFQSQLHLLNHKYRESLGYRSAYEVALARGITKRIPRRSLAKAIAFR